MSTSDERPMSGSAFVLMTVLMVLGAWLVVRWIFGTLAYLVNTAILLAVVGGAVYLYLRLRSPKGR